MLARDYMQDSVRIRQLLKWLLAAAFIVHILSAAAVYMFRVESISTTPDPLDYRLAALNLMEYHTFTLAPPGFDAPQLLRTPMYPAILAATYYLDGKTGFAMIILQSVLLIIMGWLLFKLLRAFRVPENTSLVLTALYLFEPLQWLYTLQTMTETIASFFVVVLLAGALVGKGIRSFPRAALFGIGLGLLVFEKPSAMIWVPFFLLLVFCTAGTWRMRIARIILAGLLCVLTLMPWVIRNYELTGAPIISSSGPYNFIYFKGTPATVPEAYYDPITTVTYNGDHTNDTWYAYTAQAYPMLIATEHSLLQHANYLSLISDQIECAPTVWFGITHTMDQESYGHEYGLIADFVAKPNATRDAILDGADTIIWSIALLLSLIGSYALLKDRSRRYRYVPLLGMLLVTIFINFCASWVRVILPMYPIIFIATGVGIRYVISKVSKISPSL